MSTTFAARMTDINDIVDPVRRLGAAIRQIFAIEPLKVAAIFETYAIKQKNPTATGCLYRYPPPQVMEGTRELCKLAQSYGVTFDENEKPEDLTKAHGNIRGWLFENSTYDFMCSHHGPVLVQRPAAMPAGQGVRADARTFVAEMMQKRDKLSAALDRALPAIEELDKAEAARAAAVAALQEVLVNYPE